MTGKRHETSTTDLKYPMVDLFTGIAPVAVELGKEALPTLSH